MAWLGRLATAFEKAALGGVSRETVARPPSPETSTQLASDDAAIIAEVLASEYEAGKTEDRLILALPGADIGTVILLGVAAHGSGPRCSLREPATLEEIEAFDACHAAAVADPACDAKTNPIFSPLPGGGGYEIVGIEVICVE